MKLNNQMHGLGKKLWKSIALASKEIGKKVWLFAKLQLGQARKRINAT